MECPYCKGQTDFGNSNIKHKYLHCVKACNKYFKLCPMCGTMIVQGGNVNAIKNIVNVNNIFEVSVCPNCKQTWLPDFPTSWTRSLTNLNKVYEIIVDIYGNSTNDVTKATLLNIQRSHYGVIFNTQRANSRGFQTYMTGALSRRMGEYIAALKFMMILEPRNGKLGLEIELSKLGEEIAVSNDPIKSLTYFIIAYSNIKINNGHCKPISSSCYRFFSIRFLDNILLLVDYVQNKTGDGATKYQIALSCLCRNKEEFKSHTLDYINKYSSAVIKDIYFEDEKELNRSIVSTFINIFISMYILEKKTNGTFILSPFGKEVLTFLNKRPALWYEDIEKYSTSNNLDKEDIFSKLMIWRLLKNNLIKPCDLANVTLVELNQLVESILGVKLTNIEDIHINLYYDAPIYDNLNINSNILSKMYIYINKATGMTIDEVDELVKLLHISWYEPLSKISTKYESSSVSKFIGSTKDIFRQNLQSGRQWHEKSFELLNKLGLVTIHYKNEPCFSTLIIDKLTLMLPGGTIHNPDMLIKEIGLGLKNCILVDAKDEHSIASEVPKLMGYNLYSHNSNVNSYTIIVLRGHLPTIVTTRIYSAVNEFDRITILEEEALESLVSKGLNKNSVLQFLLPFNGFKHITVSEVNKL